MHQKNPYFCTNSIKNNLINFFRFPQHFFSLNEHMGEKLIENRKIRSENDEGKIIEIESKIERIRQRDGEWPRTLHLRENTVNAQKLTGHTQRIENQEHCVP